MEILDNLLLGFSVAVTPIHLFYALIGVLQKYPLLTELVDTAG